MTFVNNDAGVPHNFALYTNSSANQKIFAGDIVTGVKTVTYYFHRTCNCRKLLFSDAISIPR